MARKSHGLRDLNWLVVAVFGVLSAVIVGAFAYQELIKPVDAGDLGNQAESVETDVSEALYVVDHRANTTSIYFRTHLGNLSSSIEDSNGSLELKPYEPDVSEQRRRFLDVSDDVAQTLHAMSLAYSDDKTIDEGRKQLDQDRQTLNQLRQQLAEQQ